MSFKKVGAISPIGDRFLEPMNLADVNRAL
jgi:hypothetical protein